MRKRFQDLNLMDAFLFAVTLEDPQTCRLVLEMIFGRKMNKVKVNVEHTILYSSDIHSIRLDVYASDTAKVDYDIEMQNNSKEDLPKRSRYYQAQMDMSGLEPGQDYSDLKPNYVIFICAYDPFGKGLYRYTYEMICKETSEPLNDGVQRIFLSTKGTKSEGVSEELKDFLGYIEHTNDDYVSRHDSKELRQLHKRVKKIKQDRRLEECYMTVDDLLREQRREALEQGREQGLRQGLEQGLEQGMEQGREQGLEQSLENIGKLCALMSADGRMDEYVKASQSPKQLKKLFREYGI